MALNNLLFHYSDITDLGVIDDEDIRIDIAALRLCGLDYPQRSIVPFLCVLDEIAWYNARIVSAQDALSQQSAALTQIFTHKRFRLAEGQRATSDIFRTIHHRTGNPISFAILYVAAARRAGLMANIVEASAGYAIILGSQDD